jgi:cytochrome oxidase Cu insertion factor (SCO1/SenC/PrrC family)
MQKKTFFLLLALFILPFVLGTAYFQYITSTGGQSTTNYGTLVSPMKPIKNTSTKGFWTFVVFAQECDELCKRRLLSAETTRVLTNENMKRMRTLFISTNPLKEEYKPTNLRAKIDTPFTQPASRQQWQEISSQFQLSNEQLLNNILLIDPLGNFMMMYPKDKQDPKKILKDLKRLLKYSRIG